MLNEKCEASIVNLIDIFCEAVRKYAGVYYEYDDFLILESVNEKKASYHLILKSSRVDTPILFPNNKVCGQFVNRVIADINKARNENCLLYGKFGANILESQYKFIDNDKKKIIIDATIYTRNRQFRMLGSCKFGRNDIFQLSSLNKFKHTPKDLKNAVEISLVGNYDQTCEEDERRIFSLAQFESHVVASPSELVSSIKKVAPSSSDIEPVYKSHFETMAKPGKIRNVTPLGNDRFVINFVNYRYCANVGRDHASNNIYIIFDQRNKTSEQKCHDEACKNFSTGPVPLTIPSSSSVNLETLPSTANAGLENIVKGKKIIAKIQVRLFST